MFQVNWNRACVLYVWASKAPGNVRHAIKIAEDLWTRLIVAATARSKEIYLVDPLCPRCPQSLSYTEKCQINLHSPVSPRVLPTGHWSRVEFAKELLIFRGCDGRIMHLLQVKWRKAHVKLLLTCQRMKTTFFSLPLNLFKGGTNEIGLQKCSWALKTIGQEKEHVLSSEKSN